MQSVAVRLIVEREREIQQFKPQEYWSLTAMLHKKTEGSKPFDATLAKINGESLDKFAVPNQAAADKIVNDLVNAP